MLGPVSSNARSGWLSLGPNNMHNKDLAPLSFTERPLAGLELYGHCWLHASNLQRFQNTLLKQ